MAAPIGNKFWKLRTKHGRDRLYKNPDDLWRACVEYFEWAEENPLLEEKVSVYQGEVVRYTVAKLRALSITGLCNYLDIDFQTWQNWKESQDLFDIIGRAEKVIYQQKFEGASADLLNASIISRELGLGEKIDHTSSDGSMSPNRRPEDMTDEELARIASGSSK